MKRIFQGSAFAAELVKQTLMLLQLTRASPMKVSYLQQAGGGSRSHHTSQSMLPAQLPSSHTQKISTRGSSLSNVLENTFTTQAHNHSWHYSHLWRSCAPSWQGHDGPSLISPTPSNLRISFLEVISASSLKGTLRGPSSKHLSPMNGKTLICINKRKWIFLPRAPCDREQPSHCQPQGPWGAGLRQCSGFQLSGQPVSARSAVLQRSKPQSLIPNPWARGHSHTDFSHRCKETCGSGSDLGLPMVHFCFPLSKLQNVLCLQIDVTKNGTCRNWEGLLWKPNPPNIFGHMNIAAKPQLKSSIWSVRNQITIQKRCLQNNLAHNIFIWIKLK